MESKLNLNFELVEKARASASKVADDVQEFIDVHTTVTVERAVCRLLGIDGVNDVDVPLPNVVVDHLLEKGILPGGAAFYVGNAMAELKAGPQEVAEKLAAGEIDFAIGTHALISGGVAYADLGLVVTDEQHRFGVAQRTALAEKGEHPHTLVMSATPIPRTLALILYGDLDVSVIDQLPPGRKPIETYAVTSAYHPRLYAFIRKQVEAGRQVYIVCPMVSENDELPDERKAVTEYAQKLQTEIFPDLKVAFVHGKMKT